ncbi:SWI/SNF complex subunit SWI3C homolog isoform X2 [Musa acuminata AAA Group]|uniref:SWI/SNF complex subunit SWI3C n=1 Tax=Musa acuminata subsp. malaccensis TaxID=214687 RepID=A0A804KCL8_MUSAM|nr:PREDICTED: SWI/SNF complex subunit SWI3C isoform X2 [Musa acuminata subsp. malaccensis]
MSPASPSLPSSDSRLKWRKRKRDANSRRQKPPDDDEDDEDNEDAGPAAEEAQEDGHDSPANPAAADPVLDLRGSEVLSDGGHRISDFPAAVRHIVNLPHPSVLALVAAERSNFAARPWVPPLLENISYGQLQALSAVLPDNPSLLQPSDLEKPSAYVCTPPPLMEGKGMVKRFGKEQLLLVPMHSDWFSGSTVHRLERQVVPHFFSGKSGDHSPEKYIGLRNKIISKYLENPGKRLSFADCQALVPNNELYDLSRIVRFLDHWGIINYLAASSVHRGLRMAGSLLKEDVSGELQLQTAPLRSIDSLILFDRPKCSLRLDDVALLSHSASVDFDAGIGDLDSRIRERFAEHTCNFCSCPLTNLHYQSQKEDDIMLCLDCFHDAKFVTGHSSLDFIRMDSRNDHPDLDGDNWTDQETLLLLEALEKYNENWNEVAEYVGSKTKAQCILHFLRLPMENGLLENIELPHMPTSVDSSNVPDPVIQNSNSNGNIVGNRDFCNGSELPFSNSANPVLSLVAFLTSAIGPRVAAACASAALSILTREDSRSESWHSEVGICGPHGNLGPHKDGTLEGQVPQSTSLAPELVKYAAMCGLSAAAVKAKLFADQEEREIQRLAATIINHQLKRLELKLKQFAELETLLLKECEQAERMRQRLSSERLRMMSTRFGSAANNLSSSSSSSSSSSVAAAAPTAVSANTVPPTMSPSVGQVNVPATYGSNLPGHRQMQFMQRQQMFGFGPRLPLSAIHPAPAPSQNVTFSSGVPNTSTPNHHPLLRPSSGNNQ